MRLWSVLMVSALAAATFTTIAAMRRSPTLVAFTLVGFTPLRVYLVGEVNPNAMEAVRALGLTVALARIFDAPVRAGAATWTVFAISAALLANVRSLGVGWALFAVLLVGLRARSGAVRDAFTTRRA